MSYAIREMFMTLQGEGSMAGRRALFLRFAGCNLWDGNPTHRDRGKGACAKWCDTDFVKGQKFFTEDLLKAMDKLWPPNGKHRFVVCTGGEPFLQLDKPLVWAMQERDWEVAVETNGTIDTEVLLQVDHLCVSPKLGSNVVVNRGTELKVVLPGHHQFEAGWSDAWLEELEEKTRFAHYFVQPQDAIDPRFVDVTFLKGGLTEQVDHNRAHHEYQKNLARCLRFIETHPRWRLSLQTHKYIDLQ